MKTPLLFQSKLLCLSLLYLITTLPFSIFLFFSSTTSMVGCPSPPLFTYPTSYGHHKHAVPSSSSSCSSPLLFPGYAEAFHEIHRAAVSASDSDSHAALTYMQQQQQGGFTGNFSAHQRRSYFDHAASPEDVPCGFLTQFPITTSDRSAMERCKGVVVASAVFGDHDKIRQPKGLGTHTLQSVCFFIFIDEFTLLGLQAHGILLLDNKDEEFIGVWRVVKLLTAQLPYDNPAMNGVIPKHLLHRLFPHARFSIWVDAKMQLTVDPLLLIHSLVIAEDVDMAVSKHPFNKHTMEEAVATARWRKWHDVPALWLQMETYCENGLQPWSPIKLPYTTDVPDTALIVRRHGIRSNLFSCLLFNELDAFNPRDQLAFAYVRDFMVPRIKINMFDVQVLEQVAIEFRHNLKPLGRSNETAPQCSSIALPDHDVEGSSCRDYLRKMWGDSEE